MATAVGIFAGRGDVIIAMGLSWIIGMYLGYQLRKIVAWLKSQG